MLKPNLSPNLIQYASYGKLWQIKASMAKYGKAWLVWPSMDQYCHL
jgi:hypothetical protein